MKRKKGQLKFGETLAHKAVEMKAVDSEGMFGAGDAKSVALEAGRTF